MLIVCYYLFLITHSLSVQHFIGRWAYQLLIIAIHFLCLSASFGSGNDVPTSFLINNIRENRQNLHIFNLWPVIYHTKKNSCANPTPETLSVEIYTSQHDYPKSTRFYFVAIDVSCWAKRCCYARYLIIAWHPIGARGVHMLCLTRPMQF